MKAYLFFFALVPGFANAGALCTPVKSEGEGHWPIPEEDFTKERAESASRELMDLLKNVKGTFITSKDVGGLDISPYVMNRLVYIKGFALKSEAVESVRLGHKEAAKWSTRSFCEFLKEEALVWH